MLPFKKSLHIPFLLPEEAANQFGVISVHQEMMGKEIITVLTYLPSDIRQ
jgi:hypothetical protein